MKNLFQFVIICLFSTGFQGIVSAQQSFEVNGAAMAEVRTLSFL